MYETLGLETTSSSGFFQGHQAGLGAVDPIFDGLAILNTVGTEKSSSLTPGAVTRGLEGNDDIDCRANDVSIKVDSETIFLLKKKKFEVTTEKKKKEKERKRENE